MPGPPPPPGAPPPPAFFPSPTKSAGDTRGALLQSIRTGTKLKKAVTNDRSSPALGKVSGAGTPSVAGNATAPSSVPNGLGLGGLFAGGMPKLRPTGGNKLGGVVGKSDTISNSTGNLSVRTPQSPTPKSLAAIQSDVQSALKKQMATDSNRNRGPPPPAPVRNFSQNNESLNGLHVNSSSLQSNSSSLHSNSSSLHSNSSSLHSNSSSFHANSSLLHANSSSLHANLSSLHAVKSSSLHRNLTGPQQLSVQNVSTLHRKASSSANLTMAGAYEPPAEPSSLPAAKPASRKPNLAPKPPVLNGKPATPPKKLVMNGRVGSTGGINRAQSMRSPRSPSPQTSPDQIDSFATKFGTVRNLSSVIDKSLTQQRARPALNGRPTAPPPSVPPQQAPPPPPPSKVAAVKPPNHAPPPPPTNAIPQPPSHAPPPPPHRTQPQVPTRAPPAVPMSMAAPPPPPRHSSMRDTAGNKRTSPIDLDIKFRDLFHPPSQFPGPGIYRGVPKFYNTKTAGSKQQAPLPPPPPQPAAPKPWNSAAC